jgi:hypothetical protein
VGRGGTIARSLAIAALAVLALPAASPASHSTLTHVSTGPGDTDQSFTDNFYTRVTPDGRHAYFQTREPLALEDPDTVSSVYEWSDQGVRLISKGPSSTSTEGILVGAADDGSRVYFATAAQLVSADTDSRLDIYQRAGSTTTLVSIGPTGGSGDVGICSRQSGAETCPWLVSHDGNAVAFLTREQLTANDTDTKLDIYVRRNGETSLVSTGPAGGNGAFDVQGANGAFGLNDVLASDDLTHIFFHTAESLVSADTNGRLDLYEWSNGQTDWVSTGPTSSSCNGQFNYCDVALKHVSGDGARVLFTTKERLVAADMDGEADDLYERSAGQTTLISTSTTETGGSYAGFLWASADGRRVFFSHTGSLQPGAPNGCYYERFDNTVTLISPPRSNGTPWCPYGPFIRGVSADGMRFWFEAAGLLPGDDEICTDETGSYACTEVYEWDRTIHQTRLISADSSTGSTPEPSIFAGASPAGDRVFFSTEERLTSDDTRSPPQAVGTDLYETHKGATTLISRTDGLGACRAGHRCDVLLKAVSNDGTRVFFASDAQHVAGDTDESDDLYMTQSLPRIGYARPRGATPVQVRLVPAYEPCTNPNASHGAPLEVAACRPPRQSSNYLTVGTFDANGAAPNSTGYVNFRVGCIPPAPNPTPLCTSPGEQADVELTTSLTDVRNKAGLNDYPGEVQISMSLRLTDRSNGPAHVEPGTTMDVPFGFTVSCSPTADNSIGSTCSATTSADAVMPGISIEDDRAIWQLGQIQVYDGGADGDVDTAGNTLFAVQGLFAP